MQFKKPKDNQVLRKKLMNILHQRKQFRPCHLFQFRVNNRYEIDQITNFKFKEIIMFKLKLKENYRNTLLKKTIKKRSKLLLTPFIYKSSHLNIINPQVKKLYKCKNKLMKPIIIRLDLVLPILRKFKKSLKYKFTRLNHYKSNPKTQAIQLYH